MNRKLVALLCALCLLFCLLPAPGTLAVSDVCFIALNEQFLGRSSLAYTINSTVYVPYSVFEAFRIYYSYHSSSSTACLYTSSRQIYFELSSGNTYDDEENFYSTSAILRDGKVYVSVAFVCSEFGLSWSYINGTGSGDVCRIKDDSVILSDSQFIAAASTQMDDEYNAYIGGAQPDGDDEPVQPTEPVSGDCLVYLSFCGLPSSSLLDRLSQYGLSACFFLSAEDIRADADTVRRLLGEGHSVGALCGADPAGAYEEFSDLLFEAAHVNTVLIAAVSREFDAACRAAAEELRLVFWDYDVDGVRDGAGIAYASLVTAPLEYRPARLDIRIQCSDLTDGCIASVFLYMETNDVTVRVPNEVEAA